MVGGKIKDATDCSYARMKEIRCWTDKLPTAFILAFIDRREHMENFNSLFSMCSLRSMRARMKAVGSLSVHNMQSKHPRGKAIRKTEVSPNANRCAHRNKEPSQFSKTYCLTTVTINIVNNKREKGSYCAVDCAVSV